MGPPGAATDHQGPCPGRWAVQQVELHTPPGAADAPAPPACLEPLPVLRDGCGAVCAVQPSHWEPRWARCIGAARSGAGGAGDRAGRCGRSLVAPSAANGLRPCVPRLHGATGQLGDETGSLMPLCMLRSCRPPVLAAPIAPPPLVDLPLPAARASCARTAPRPAMSGPPGYEELPGGEPGEPGAAGPPAAAAVPPAATAAGHCRPTAASPGNASSALALLAGAAPFNQHASPPTFTVQAAAGAPAAAPAAAPRPLPAAAGLGAAPALGVPLAPQHQQFATQFNAGLPLQQLPPSAAEEWDRAAVLMSVWLGCAAATLLLSLLTAK